MRRAARQSLVTLEKLQRVALLKRVQALPSKPSAVEDQRRRQAGCPADSVVVRMNRRELLRTPSAVQVRIRTGDCPDCADGLLAEIPRVPQRVDRTPDFAAAGTNSAAAEAGAPGGTVRSKCSVGRRGFPRLSRRAQELGATLLFVDQSGIDSQSVQGQMWGVRGRTPAVRVAQARFRWNLLAVISPDGQLYATNFLKSNCKQPTPRRPAAQGALGTPRRRRERTRTHRTSQSGELRGPDLHGRGAAHAIITDVFISNCTKRLRKPLILLVVCLQLLLAKLVYLIA